MDGSALEAGMRPWRGIVGGLVAVLLVAGCGIIPEPEEQARELATDRVRIMARRNATELLLAVPATDAAGARKVVRRHTETLDRSPGPDMTSRGGLLAAWSGATAPCGSTWSSATRRMPVAASRTLKRSSSCASR